MTNPYATDGVCHNANTGTYGHECGKPATWIGTKASGWAMGFCDHCKEHGDERHGKTWSRIDPCAPAEQRVEPGVEPVEPVETYLHRMRLKYHNSQPRAGQQGIADLPLFQTDLEEFTGTNSLV